MESRNPWAFGNAISAETTLQVVIDGNVATETAGEVSAGDVILDGDGNEVTIESVEYGSEAMDSYAISTADGQVAIAAAEQIIDAVSHPDGHISPTTPAQMAREGVADGNGEYRFRVPYVSPSREERDAILPVIAGNCGDLDMAFSSDGFPIYRGTGYDDLGTISYAYELSHVAGIATSRIVRSDEQDASPSDSESPVSYLEIMAQDDSLLDRISERTSLHGNILRECIIDAVMIPQHVAAPDEEASMQCPTSDGDITFLRAGYLYGIKPSGRDESALIGAMFSSRAIRDRVIPECIMEAGDRERAAFLKGIIGKSVKSAKRDGNSISISIPAKSGTARYESIQSLLDGLGIEHDDAQTGISIPNPPVKLLPRLSDAYVDACDGYRDIMEDECGSVEREITSTPVLSVASCGRIGTIRLRTCGGNGTVSTAEGFAMPI